MWRQLLTHLRCHMIVRNDACSSESLLSGVLVELPMCCYPNNSSEHSCLDSGGTESQVWKGPVLSSACYFWAEGSGNSGFGSWIGSRATVCSSWGQIQNMEDIQRNELQPLDRLPDPLCTVYRTAVHLVDIKESGHVRP